MKSPNSKMHLIWDNVKVAKCNCVIQPKKEPIIFQKVRLQFRFCNQKICSVKPFRFHQPNKNFPGQIKDAWYSFFFKIYVIIIQLCDYNQSCHYCIFRSILIIWYCLTYFIWILNFSTLNYVTNLVLFVFLGRSVTLLAY